MAGRDWPAWTAYESPPILLDYNPITATLSKIHTQIDILRERIEDLTNKSESEIVPQLKQLSEDVVNLINSDAKRTESSLNQEEKTVVKVSPRIPAVNFSEIENKLRAEMNDMKSSYDSKISDLEDMIKSMKSESMARVTYEVQEKQLLSRISTLDKRISDLSSKIDSNNSVLEDKLTEKLNEIDESNAFARQARDAILNFEQKLQELELKMSHLDDSNSMNEMRLKNVEKHSLNALYTADSTKSKLEMMEQETIVKIEDRITYLADDKASRSELYAKADIEALGLKASTDDIVRLEEMVNKLHKLLVRNSNDNKVYMDNWEKKNDTKLEYLSEWLVKRVRKEFSGMGGQFKNEPKDGADIGKVKCLVCDQTIHQNKNAETVFGGPAMIPQLPGHMRSQSPSGPRQRPSSPPQHNQLPQGDAEDEKHQNTVQSLLNSMTMNQQNNNEVPRPEQVSSPRLSLKPPRVTATTSGLATSADREYVQVAQTLFPPTKEQVDRYVVLSLKA